MNFIVFESIFLAFTSILNSGCIRFSTHYSFVWLKTTSFSVRLLFCYSTAYVYAHVIPLDNEFYNIKGVI